MNDKINNNNSFLRILSSIILISIALFGIFMNDKFLIFSLCVIVFLATYEWVVITEDLNTQILKYTKSIFNVIIFMLSLLSFQFSLIFFIIIFLINLFSKNLSRVNKLFVLLGPVYLCLPFIFLYEIRHLNNGLDIILWFLLIVWSTDTFSYICGKHFGGKKLCPSLSPNKTWSGFIFGILLAILISIICCYIKEYSLLNGLIFGLILAVFTQFGDLFESWVKRKHSIKDSGKFIPGHGGVLDRLDGLMLSSLILYIGYIFYV